MTQQPTPNNRILVNRLKSDDLSDVKALVEQAQAAERNVIRAKLNKQGAEGGDAFSILNAAIKKYHSFVEIVETVQVSADVQPLLREAEEALNNAYVKINKRTQAAILHASLDKAEEGEEVNVSGLKAELAAVKQALSKAPKPEEKTPEELNAAAFQIPAQQQPGAEFDFVVVGEQAPGVLPPHSSLDLEELIPVRADSVVVQRLAQLPLTLQQGITEFMAEVENTVAFAKAAQTIARAETQEESAQLAAEASECVQEIDQLKVNVEKRFNIVLPEDIDKEFMRLRREAVVVVEAESSESEESGSYSSPQLSVRSSQEYDPADGDEYDSTPLDRLIEEAKDTEEGEENFLALMQEYQVSIAKVDAALRDAEGRLSGEESEDGQSVGEETAVDLLSDSDSEPNSPVSTKRSLSAEDLQQYKTKAEELAAQAEAAGRAADELAEAGDAERAFNKAKEAAASSAGLHQLRQDFFDAGGVTAGDVSSELNDSVVKARSVMRRSFGSVEDAFPAMRAQLERATTSEDSAEVSDADSGESASNSSQPQQTPEGLLSAAEVAEYLARAKEYAKHVEDAMHRATAALMRADEDGVCDEARNAGSSFGNLRDLRIDFFKRNRSSSPELEELFAKAKKTLRSVSRFARLSLSDSEASLESEFVEEESPGSTLEVEDSASDSDEEKSDEEWSPVVDQADALDGANKQLSESLNQQARPSLPTADVKPEIVGQPATDDFRSEMLAFLMGAAAMMQLLVSQQISEVGAPLAITAGGDEHIEPAAPNAALQAAATVLPAVTQLGSRLVDAAVQAGSYLASSTLEASQPEVSSTPVEEKKSAKGSSWDGLIQALKWGFLYSSVSATTASIDESKAEATVADAAVKEFFDVSDEVRTADAACQVDQPTVVAEPVAPKVERPESLPSLFVPVETRGVSDDSSTYKDFSFDIWRASVIGSLGRTHKDENPEKINFDYQCNIESTLKENKADLPSALGQVGRLQLQEKEARYLLTGGKEKDQYQRFYRTASVAAEERTLRGKSLTKKITLNNINPPEAWAECKRAFEDCGFTNIVIPGYELANQDDEELDNPHDPAVSMRL